MKKKIIIILLIFLSLIVFSSCKNNDNITPQIFNDYERVELKTAKATESEYYIRKVNDSYSYYSNDGNITIYYEEKEIYKYEPSEYHLYGDFYVNDDVLYFSGDWLEMVDKTSICHDFIFSVTKTGEAKIFSLDGDFSIYGLINNGLNYYLLLRNRQDESYHFYKMDMEGNILFDKLLEKKIYWLYLINNKFYALEYEYKSGKKYIYTFDEDVNFEEIACFEGTIENVYVNDNNLEVIYYKFENSYYNFYKYSNGEINKLFVIKNYSKEAIENNSSSLIYNFAGLTYSNNIYYFVYEIVTDATYNFYNRMVIVCYYEKTNEYKIYSPKEETSIVWVANNIIIFGDFNIITQKYKLKKIIYE